MKVILKEDVKALGKKGDVVEVSDGYARNFILKTGKGVEANGKNLNDLKLKKANDDKVAQEHYEAAVELGKKIEAGKSPGFHQNWRRRKSIWLCILQRNCSRGKISAWAGSR